MLCCCSSSLFRENAREILICMKLSYGKTVIRTVVVEYYILCISTFIFVEVAQAGLAESDDYTHTPVGVVM